MLRRDPELLVPCVVPPNACEAVDVDHEEEDQFHQVQDLFDLIHDVQVLNDLLQLQEATKFKHTEQLECFRV